MFRRQLVTLFSTVVCFSSYAIGRATENPPVVEIPKVLVDNWKIELVRAEPELVTPVGCRMDAKGRLFVVECHTHFPPDKYPGPKTDRIYAFTDSNNDGTLDKQSLYYEGGKATMGLATSDDEWLYVVTRSEVKRIRDSDGDGRADESQTLIRQETNADYPHNGLSSITFSPDGWLYFGQGENFGLPYKLVGPHGSLQTGGGEGGNLFRCQRDGSQLERVATGFWNPFGTCFDPAGRLWTVENDPDARPPCRLIHVVPTGDYGFQFRFGRAGTHPLLAWNGELPGTLRMSAGTGEAPCAVLPYGEHLLVTSWGDNRIERFRLVADGATWKGEFETMVQGTPMFRPVDMATAPDGSIYVTDWVDRSYPVHQKGRLWRLVPKDQRTAKSTSLPPLSALEVMAKRIAEDSQVTLQERWTAASNPDSFLVQAAVAGIAKFHSPLTMKAPTDEHSYAAWLQACRWKEMESVDANDGSARRERLRIAMERTESKIRRLAVRYIAETGDKLLLPVLRTRLKGDSIDAIEFGEVVAAISFLETGSASPKARDPAREKALVDVLLSDRSVEIKALALHSLPSENEAITLAMLDQWVQSNHRPLAREAIEFLSGRKNDASYDLLVKWGENEKLDTETRADAVALLKVAKERFGDSLAALRKRSTTPLVLQKEIDRVVQTASVQANHPDPSEWDAWWKLLETGGDKESGRRVFSRSVCATCHAINGRGSMTGPDLGTLRGTTTRQRILESILQPSREIGPLYAAWRIRTSDDRVLVGAKLNGGGERVKYLAADGTTFELTLDEIEEQSPSPLSIMPSDAYRTLTMEEIRDLLAFLE